MLIGGFAASISLKKFLDQRLEQYCRRNRCHINLIRPDNWSVNLPNDMAMDIERLCNADIEVSMHLVRPLLPPAPSYGLLTKNRGHGGTRDPAMESYELSTTEIFQSTRVSSRATTVMMGSLMYSIQ